MGIAILMVITYHFFCWIYNPIGGLNVGYAGVDVFLFLSGVGLAQSYSRNPITRFYANRLKRIYPLYLIAVIATFLIFNTHWDFLTLLLNLTPIGLFIENGTNRYDWYLEGLLGLYLLFPLLYKYGKTGVSGVILATLLVAITLYYVKLPWWYDCLLGRLPIFIYGIIFVNHHKYVIPICIIGMLLFLPCRHFVSPSLATSFIALPIIYTSLIISQHLPHRIANSISRIGQYTLEIYIANLFVYYALGDNKQEILIKIIIFISIQTVSTILLIFINKLLSRKLQI